MNWHLRFTTYDDYDRRDPVQRDCRALDACCRDDARKQAAELWRALLSLGTWERNGVTYPHSPELVCTEPLEP